MIEQAFDESSASTPRHRPGEAHQRDQQEPRLDRPLALRRVLLGEVVATPSARRNILDVALSFTVPADAALGRQLVEVCNSPCDTRLAYMPPTEVVGARGEVEELSASQTACPR